MACFASSDLFLFCVPFFFFLVPAHSANYTVGGRSGWTTPSRAKLDYPQWASTITFELGNSLEFDYVPKAHTVLEVTRTNFRYCNTSDPLASFDDGKTVIVLTKPGSYYFIDGVGDHCKEGQKFQVKVAGASGVASSPAVGFEPAVAPAPEPSSQAIPPAVAAASNLKTSLATLASFVCLTAALWL